MYMICLVDSQNELLLYLSVKHKKNFKEIYSVVSEVYGDHALKKNDIFKRIVGFNDDNKSYKNNERPEQPPTSWVYNVV